MKRRKSENALFVRLCLGTATSGCSHLSKTMTDHLHKSKNLPQESAQTVFVHSTISCL